MALKEDIRGLALELGADMVGFGKASRFSELKEQLLNRKVLDFEISDVEKRINPFLHMESGKTFVTVLKRYDLHVNNLSKGEVKVASSAFYDYHKTIRKILSGLKDHLDGIGVESQMFCDTEGLLDREVARRSGLGYYGKSCNLINPKLGTSFNIGYLLIDLEIKPDEILEIDCGSCDICVKSCPGGAINGDYTINPLKCISYQTQKKNQSADDRLHGFIYGCDICQIVCPVNEVQLERNESNIFCSEDFLWLSNRMLKRTYANRDFIWIGPSRLKRNVIKNQKEEAGNV